MRVLIVVLLVALGLLLGLRGCSNSGPLEISFPTLSGYPAFLNMGQMAMGSKEEGTEFVKTSRTWKIKVKSRASEAVLLRARLEEGAPEGMEVRLDGEIDLPPAGSGFVFLILSPPPPVGPFEGSVTLYAENNADIRVTFPFKGETVRPQLEGAYAIVRKAQGQPSTNVGQSAPGKVHEFAFEVFSYGTEPLVVEEWEIDHPAAVHLEAVQGGETVAPGEALLVRGRVRAPSTAGTFRYVVSVRSNAVNAPLLQTTVHGRVEAPYYLTKDLERDRRAVRKLRPEYTTVVVARPGSKPFTVGRITGHEGIFEIVSRGSEEPALRQELRVRLLPGARLGPHKVRVRIQLQPSGHELVWTFYPFVIVGTIVSDPPRVEFGRLGPGARVEHTVRLVSTTSSEFSVISAVAKGDHVEVEVLKRSGLAPKLRLRLRVGLPSGRFADVIVVETDDPDTPRLQIPVSGTLP